MDAHKIEQVTGHRFEGYTVEMLAMEIDMFRSGAGAGSMTAAVDALKAMAQVLAETDETLGEELGRIGVAWDSDAAALAKAAFFDRSTFAKDAHEKVGNAAQAAFVLAEAFTTLLNKLPDAQTLRDGAKGLGVGDLLANLIGHETDHAAKVRAANAARDQAVDALNEFKRASGAELAGIEDLGPPESIVLDEAPAPDPRVAMSGGGFDTMAAAAFGVGSTGSGGTTSPVNAGTGSTAAGGGGAPCPPTSTVTSRQAGGGRSTGSAAAPTAGPVQTQPSVSETAGGAAVVGAGAGGAGAAVVGAGAGNPAPRGSSGESAPGRTPPTTPGSSQPPAGGVVAPAPGASTGSGSGTGSGGGTPATPGGPGGPAGGPGGPAGGSPGPGGQLGGKPGGSSHGGGTPGGLGSKLPGTGGFAGGGGAGFAGGGLPGGEALAGGKQTGATPPSPTPNAPVGPGAGSQVPTGGAGAGAAGGAAAALGAAGVAGATSGERDRQHRPRGYGQDAEVDGRPLYDFEVGEVEDEQSARNVERVEPPAGDDRPQYLEPAATQEGLSERSRVRSYGVDDVDLFADQRMVAPELIDDAPRSDRDDDPQGAAP